MKAFSSDTGLPSLAHLLRRAGALALALPLLLAACAGSAPGTRSAATAPQLQTTFVLNIAHINDHHSHLEAFANTELLLEGMPTQVELGGFARQTAYFKSLAGTPNLLKLHAGDAFTGSLYYTFFKGQADAQMMGTVCFDAFTPGNHEFDEGDAVLRDFLDALAATGCRTAVVSANVVPQAGTPLAPDGKPPYLSPWAIRSIGGVEIGLVGLTIAGKTQASSRPLPTTRFLPEAAAAQAAIDALRAQGVRHIVLLTHQGWQADRALAAQLSGVDVIIGGDSHTLLGDFQALGLASAGPYPTVTRNREGEPVCIGQAWEYSKAAALMNVAFDGQGAVTHCGGQAVLLIGERFRRKDATGAWQAMDAASGAALQSRLAANPALLVLPPDPQASEVLARFSGQVEAQKARHIGEAAQPLCLVRVPGEPANPRTQSPGCETAHTLARGSDVAQVVARAFLQASRRADFALQNAGGVRAPIAAGPVTMDTAFTVLPYNNVLVELELTGAQVLAALEDGVANHLDKGQSTGSHPYAAGLRWSLDLSQPRGQRFASVQVQDKTSGQWQALEPQRRYVLVTSDYLASGRDGYATLAAASRGDSTVNTYQLYTQTFVDDIVARGTLTRPAGGEMSHQQVTTRDGRRLP